MHSDKYIQALVDSQSFFEIHQENVLGVNMDVFKNRPRSLVDFIELSASHGEKPYLIYQDKVISFTQHLTLVKKQLIFCNHNIMLNLETELLFMLQIALNGLYFSGLL
jgi:hypothetical protein